MEGENTEVIEQDATFERVTFTARSLAVQTKLSYELLEDMTPESASLVENELTQALALELDRVALRGTGTAPEPRGIRNQSGVTVQSLGANGATPSYASVLAAVTAVKGANITPDGVLLASRTAQQLGCLTDSTGQPLQPPPPVAELPFYVTNQLPVTLTQGTSTDTSELYIGKWDELLIGVRPSIGVRVARLDKADFLQVALVAWLRADIQLAHPAAFAVVTGARP